MVQDMPKQDAAWIQDTLVFKQCKLLAPLRIQKPDERRIMQSRMISFPTHTCIKFSWNSWWTCLRCDFGNWEGKMAMGQLHVKQEKFS